MTKAKLSILVFICVFTATIYAQQRGAQPPAQPEPVRPIAMLDSVWIEELTDLEVRDKIRAGMNRGIILTGGLESNGPYLPTGKHNYVLKAIGEKIARDFGNALIAPIVTLEPGAPQGPTIAAGSVRLSPQTYRAVLTDMADSLRAMGMKEVFLMGDSGGNQTHMKVVAAALNAQYNGNPARFHHIPEYYNYPDVRRLTQASGFPEKIDPNASRGSDQIHDEFSIDAIIATLGDPRNLRLEQRRAVNKTTINGVDLLPFEKTVEWGKKVVAFRAKAAEDAMNRAAASRSN
jgi:creatinine amidohydrolase